MSLLLDNAFNNGGMLSPDKYLQSSEESRNFVLSAQSQWFRQVHKLIVLNTVNRRKKSPWRASKANFRTEPRIQVSERHVWQGWMQGMYL